MPKVNLFSTYFNCHDSERQKELDYCHEQNKANPLIDSIKVFSERPHYNDFFIETRKYPDDINILANADIYFNETLKYVQFMKQGQAFAITRWEDVKGKVIKFEERNKYNRHAQAKHSQDVWVFLGEAKGMNGNFYIGIPGCDNRIAYEMSRSYRVYNPCETIQCIHKHTSPGRDYNIPEDSIERIPQPWKLIMPCSIDSNGRIIEQVQQRQTAYGRRSI